MADHMIKKYIAKVEKTIYVVETIEFVCETEREAEELLDDYCASHEEAWENIEIVDREEQESIVDHAWIDSSEELGVNEFMKINGGQTLERN